MDWFDWFKGMFTSADLPHRWGEISGFRLIFPSNPYGFTSGILSMTGGRNRERRGLDVGSNRLKIADGW